MVEPIPLSKRILGAMQRTFVCGVTISTSVHCTPSISTRTLEAVFPKCFPTTSIIPPAAETGALKKTDAQRTNVVER